MIGDLKPSATYKDSTDAAVGEDSGALRGFS